MADNYLEKKMEEHRTRMAAGAAKRTPAARGGAARGASGGLTFEYPKMRVYVPGGADTSLGRELIAVLRAAGVDVDFSGLPSAEATKLGQRLGARFYPIAGRLTPEAALEAAQARCDAVALLPGESLPDPTTLRVAALPDPLPRASEASLARLLAVLLHPSMNDLAQSH